MSTWLLNYWNHLRTSFWFVPAMLSMLGITLSLAMIRVDEQVPEMVITHASWLWARGPDGALSLLSTIAGSMITIAGVVFSITIVALTLASSQFGPRLLRNFMRDPGNQISLGTFIATFLYCLFVIRAVKGGEPEQVFVPFLSITVALFLAVASLGVLIYFIHHVAVSIQAPHVVAFVSNDLHDAITRLFPTTIQDEKGQASERHDGKDIPGEFEKNAIPVTASCGGYVQAIAVQELMDLAKSANVLIRVERRPGHFVVKGSPLALVWPEQNIDTKLAAKIHETFILGVQRTQEQDVLYALDQLVEIAVRALSPGINDPFTALGCIDRLGAALRQFGERVVHLPYHYDEQDVLRVIACPVTFRGMTEAAFNQIRRYGRSDASVTMRLLETIAVVAQFATRKENRLALREQAIMIKRGSEEGLPEEMDRMAVDQRYRTVMAMLGNEMS